MKPAKVARPRIRVGDVVVSKSPGQLVFRVVAVEQQKDGHVSLKSPSGVWYHGDGFRVLP